MNLDGVIVSSTSLIGSVMLSCTDGIMDMEAVELGLGQPAPNLRLVDFVRVVEVTVN
jgi:hypothetical protein